MKSLCLEKYGSLDFLRVIDRPIPKPGRGEVRVTVHASSLNPADYKVALGEVKILHGRRFPMPLGYDFSGTVSMTGPGVDAYKVGDEVFGFLPYGPFNQQGAFSESLLAKVNEIVRKPRRVTHAQAAAAATAGISAIQALRDLGRLKPGGRVLVTGVSGAVGSLAVGVAKNLGASEVDAIGSGKGIDLAVKMGASKTIDRKKQNVFEGAQGPFDVVFDAAAAYRWSDWKAKLKPSGAYVTTLPSVAFAIDKIKSVGANSRTTFVSVKSKRDDLQVLADWLEAGLHVPIESTIPIEDVAKHLQRLKQGQVLGKVGVAVSGS